MRLIGFFGASLAVALGATQLAVTARAADLGPLYDAPDASSEPLRQPLEFGTGWYLRGDGAYADEDHPKLNQATSTFDKAATSGGYAFGIGAGYKFNAYLRVDVTADYLDPFEYTGLGSCGTGCALSTKTEVWRYDGLANAYVDLGTWYGITPYVGAGVGFGGTRQDMRQTTATAGGATTTPTSSRDAYQLAWAGMGGLSYAFAPHAMVDVGYRYLDLGRTTIQVSPMASTRKDITEQQVRVGLRYMVD